MCLFPGSDDCAVSRETASYAGMQNDSSYGRHKVGETGPSLPEKEIGVQDIHT